MTSESGPEGPAAAAGPHGVRLSLMTLVAAVAAAWVVISSFLTWSTPDLSRVIFYGHVNRAAGSTPRLGPYRPPGQDLWQAAPDIATVLVTSAVLVAVLSPRWTLTRPVIWLAAVLAFVLAVINWIHPPAYLSDALSQLHPTGRPRLLPTALGGTGSHPGVGQVVAVSASVALVIFACSLGRPRFRGRSGAPGPAAPWPPL